LSAGAVYTWFESKQAIIEEFANRGLRRHRELQSPVLDGAAALQAIDGYLASLQAVMEDPVRARMNAHLLSEAASGSEAGAALRRIIASGAEVLESAMSALAPGAPDARERALVLQAAALGAVVQRILEPEGEVASLELARQLISY
jgi:AcrR family transcriptional regulator